MILGFKTKFENGEPTNFEQQILEGIKIHTLREGDRWSAGNFIHMATGVRSKEYKQFNAAREDLQKCVSTQEVFMTYYPYRGIEVTIGDDKYLWKNNIDLLIKNDGLRTKQFIDWFFPNNKDSWSGQIIHWTDFKY